MAYWQSPEWLARTTSIYPVDASSKEDPVFMPWWKEAWVLFCKSPAYDIVLTMGIRESFAYALLCRVCHRKPKQVMTEVFIDQAKPDSYLWRIKTWFYRWLARDATGFITNSTREISTNARRFGVPEERFRYVPLSSTIDHPEYIGPSEGYLFCAGRTLRDYETLKRVMLETDATWHVVSGAHDLQGENFPERINVHREINRENYLSLLRGARLVVLPLLDTERSTGQVVLLEAMSFGKPCITTESPGTIDIIRHGHNGLLTENANPRLIIQYISDLENNPERAMHMGREGFEDILSRYSHREHTAKRLQAIEELWRMKNN